MSRNCVSLARKQSNLYENHKMQSLYPHASGIVAPNPQPEKKEEAIKEKCYSMSQDEELQIKVPKISRQINFGLLFCVL